MDINDFEIRQVDTADTATLKAYAEIVSEYSWGRDYPIHPLNEIMQAEFVLCVYHKSVLVGGSDISRVASPDGIDNGELWFANVVVMPAHRGYGLMRNLYDPRLEYALSQPGRILVCTEREHMCDFFSKKGWIFLRETKNEGGETSYIYEYPR